ncbi:MAG: HIT family protein [Tepidisphaera sp.]
MAKHQDNCEICKRIGEAREGRHAGLIAELDTGYAVLGDSQFFRGYSVLLCKTPATELFELPRETRARYLEEVSQLAEAVAKATGCHKINYECLGNQVHHLHFHVFPRRETDPQPLMPVWGQMPAGSDAEKYKFEPSRDGAMKESIAKELRNIRASSR